ncbi:hypothetical protein DPEC_G00289660 [Dallia pectoralis]|uniref:Uncharacterized protein n=1 Tax=Dallia pectoralis TaxID=75939 RepID=A0ACC2FH92_DALPE|nr:hypothetical protein DPEC_G00289660 [Dallia pectoralis]
MGSHGMRQPRVDNARYRGPTLTSSMHHSAAHTRRDKDNFQKTTRVIYKMIQVTHHLENVAVSGGKYRAPISLQRKSKELEGLIRPANPSDRTLLLLQGNAKNWLHTTLQILEEHYLSTLQELGDQLKRLRGSDWTEALAVAKAWGRKNLGRKLQQSTLDLNFDIASAWASSHFGRRLKRETLREVRAQLVQRLAGAPSSRPADGGDDAIQPATQSDPERTTAQHSQQTLDVPVRTPASVSIPAMAQSRLIVTAEIHPPPRGQRSPEILMTPTPSAVPGQVTTGTNMEQGGDWSPDIQHSSPPGFPSPGRSSPTLQTPREQRPARGPRQPPGGTTAVPEYPVSAPSRRDEPMRRPPTSDEDTDGEQQSGPFVPELSTSTPPRRDEPLMELTSDEEDQDGEQQPEPLVLPVTKDETHTQTTTHPIEAAIVERKVEVEKVMMMGHSKGKTIPVGFPPEPSPVLTSPQSRGHRTGPIILSPEGGAT